MARKEQFNFKISDEMKQDLIDYREQNKHKYEDMASVIREAISEKIYPVIRKRMIKTEFVSMRSDGDPDICALFPPNPPQ